jgi:hypothetical protein
MNPISNLVSEFAIQAGLQIPRFTSWNFRDVSTVAPCPSAAQYFADSIPSETVDLGMIRILSPTHLLQENTDLIPGCRVANHGFITFAATDCGDSISVDLVTGYVYLILTDKFDGEMIAPGWKPDYTGFLDRIPITRDNIIASCQAPWPDIGTALVALTTDEDG